MEAIIAARTQGGPFLDLFDFCARVDARKLNKRALEALIRSGAADNLGPTRQSYRHSIDQDRAVMFCAIAEAVKTAEQKSANQHAGMMDLFGDSLAPEAGPRDAYGDFQRVRIWSMKERLQAEKDTLGLYLTGHPIDEYEAELAHLVSARIADLKPDKYEARGEKGRGDKGRGDEKPRQSIAGLVVAQRTMKTKRGDTMAFVTLDDRTGRIEVAVFADTYNQCRDLLLKEGLLVIGGQVSIDDFSGQLKMRALSIRPLAEVRDERVRELCLELESGTLPANFIAELGEILEPYRGSESQAARCPLVIDYRRSNARAQVRLGAAWAIRPEDELLQRLRHAYGAAQVRLIY